MRAQRIIASLAAAGIAAVAAAPAHGVGAQLVVGAAFPAAFAFDPSGRIFYGERFTGEIRLFDPATGADTAFFTLPDIATAGEQGLLGLAVHPSYPDRPYVYAYYTRTQDGTTANMIVRLTDSMGAGQGLRTIRTLPAGTNHNGGVIHFGPDGMLYAAVGDVGVRANAQDLSSLAGKILRMTPLGRVPAGNPFGSRVWAFGIRNTFGFAFDPRTGNLFELQNGPECIDELNRIEKGGNYAWGPSATCAGAAPESTNQDGPEPRKLPLTFYTPPIAPTGAAFCERCGLGATRNGKLIFGDWNNGDLHLVKLTSDRLDVASETILLDRSAGILAVERAPSRAVYFSDPNGIYRLVR